jgi:hypothetical protein
MSCAAVMLVVHIRSADRVFVVGVRKARRAPER